MTAQLLPPIPSRETIRHRLQQIFPEGIEGRVYLIGDMAVNTVSVFFYIGAVEGFDLLLQPGHIYYMSDRQLASHDDNSRISWAGKSKWARDHIANPWYPGEGSRESIRDDVIKDGLRDRTAVKIKPGVSGQANKPRYYLSDSFAALFHEGITGDELSELISEWQKRNLNKETQLAVGIRKTLNATDRITVEFSDGTRRTLPNDESSIILKNLIESFSKNFLTDPHVVSYSTSEEKYVNPNPRVIHGLNFSKEEISKIFPDLVLLDIYKRNEEDTTLLIFIEVVATSGSMTQQRKDTILALLGERGYDISKVAFITAFLDRASRAYSKKNLEKIAWGSFIWFANYPDNILIMKGQSTGERKKLSDLMK
ncbi:MAG: BsuBI/PstI family type II restriction endonuclease [Methanoregula sp.]